MNQEFENNSIFWIETEKIHPNPYQPRKEFNEVHLQDLADSIRQYGVLQPLVVTRKEIPKEDGSGIDVHYELIAGERRLRASRLAGVTKVPAVVRQGVESTREKLELAIIENLQREDLNPVDRALAFARLVNEFGLKHTEVAKKVGKSREYVSNTLRLLVLPQDILDALSKGRITEGHARPLMMLADRPEEQSVLFKEIMFKKLTVREAEAIARGIAKEKQRKKSMMDPETERLQMELAESLGTRVAIEKRQVGGGRVVIDYFSLEDLRALLDRVNVEKGVHMMRSLRDATVSGGALATLAMATPLHVAAPTDTALAEQNDNSLSTPVPMELMTETQPYDDRPTEEVSESDNSDGDADLYAVSSFTV